MRTSLSLLLATLASAGAHAQSLYDDFSRGMVPYVTSTGATAYNYPASTPFSIGLVDTVNGVLLNQGINYRSAQSKGDILPSVFGTTPSPFSSGVWWNFGSSIAKVTQTLLLSGNSVTLYAVDAIPTIEIVREKGLRNAITITMSATEPHGIGNIVFQTFSNGAWTNVYSMPIRSAPKDTRTMSFESRTRLRWMLVKTTTACQATFSLRIE